jgi:hypothetical protein
MRGVQTDLTGQTFGYLIAISFVGRTSKGTAKWLCRCVCGKETVVQNPNLRSGSTKSCGCKREELRINRKRPLPLGEGAKRAILSKYKKWARHRNHSWELSDDLFFGLTQKNCFYCGDPPSKQYLARHYGAFIYNGVDRCDNTKGYTPNNCVSCCNTCNLAKRKLSIKDFIQHIRKIAKYTESL